MAESNINLQPGYWDRVWEQEGAVTWRQYPGCFGRICWAVGHFNEVLELGCGVELLARKLVEFGNVVTEPEHVRKSTPESLEALLSPYGVVFLESFIDQLDTHTGTIIALPTIMAALYT